MSENPPQNTAASAAPNNPAAVPQEQAWKPEPRSWTWKDIFTAPMLAFKPKCMLVAVATIALICLIEAFYRHFLMVGLEGKVVLVDALVRWLFIVIEAVVFGIGATFIATFFKADLLDDEFLSLKEAISAYKQRFLPSVLVPAFLVAVAAGSYLAIYVGQLLCSIPYVGAVLYALFHLIPLAWLVSLFALLLCTGVALGFFVFPAIVAIRKHSWFDNVIDTFEAVGTKPHLLLANLALTLAMALVAYGFGVGALGLLKARASSSNLPGFEVVRAEQAANDTLKSLVHPAEALFAVSPALAGQAVYERLSGEVMEKGFYQTNGFYDYVIGPVLGFLQAVIIYIVLGYVVNILLAGGMLTYLTVREDDYWDDEDLEDLDKLAKELEEEAQKAAAEAAAAPASPVAQTASTAPAAPADAANAVPQDYVETTMDGSSAQRPSVDAQTPPKDNPPTAT